MGDNTLIEWADATVNFWIGCTKVSPGCDFCYAERDWDHRYKRVQWGPHGVRSMTKSPMAALRAIAKRARKEGRRLRVFINSLADTADNHRSIPEGVRAQIFMAAKLLPEIDLLILTKRPQNLQRILPLDWGNGYPNVWLGTTVENQEEAARRIPHLLATPAALRFLSCEPLLGPVDLLKNEEWAVMRPHGTEYDKYNPLTGMWEYDADETGSSTSCGFGPRINWVICGGESGAKARPMDAAWAESLRDQCRAAGVAFFMKQMGGVRKPFPEIPGDLLVREFPNA